MIQWFSFAEMFPYKFEEQFADVCGDIGTPRRIEVNNIPFPSLLFLRFRFFFNVFQWCLMASTGHCLLKVLSVIIKASLELLLIDSLLATLVGIVFMNTSG